MLNDPLQKIMKTEFVCCYFEYRVRQFLLRVLELDPVKGKKDQHGMSADALIAVDECVIFYKTVSKARRFLLNGRKCICAAESLKWRMQCRVQKSGIANPVDSTRLGDELGMQMQDLLPG